MSSIAHISTPKVVKNVSKASSGSRVHKSVTRSFHAAVRRGKEYLILRDIAAGKREFAAGKTKVLGSLAELR